MAITQDEFVSRYDSMILSPLLREYFGQTGFFNLGYWLPDAKNAKESCEQLMEKILELIPEKKGKILDVACGLGSTTNYISKYYSPADIFGINISSAQLETCKVNAPGCNFLLMDAVQMEFADNEFDNVICVEAAFHFNTRERFLQEAHRILKSNGYLVMADIIYKNIPEADLWMNPHENDISDFEKYKNLYFEAGFGQVEIIDITEQSWTEFYRHFKQWLLNKFQAVDINEAISKQIDSLDERLDSGSSYLLVSAKK